MYSGPMHILRLMSTVIAEVVAVSKADWRLSSSFPTVYCKPPPPNHYQVTHFGGDYLRGTNCPT